MLRHCVEIAFWATNFSCIRQRGTPVYCPLPPFVVEALNAIPEHTAYFFWTGNATPKTAPGIWQESLKRPFILAGVPDGHAHRFRDTFSVELLLAGLAIERVSIIGGIRAGKLRTSTTRLGFVRVKSSWRPMFGVLGRPLNLNEGYTAGTRKNAPV